MILVIVMANIMKLSDFKKLSPQEKQNYIDSLSQDEALQFMRTLGFTEGYRSARKHARHISSVDYYRVLAQRQSCILTFLLLIIVYLVLGLLVMLFQTKVFFYIALVFGTVTTLMMLKNIAPTLRTLYSDKGRDHH